MLAGHTGITDNSVHSELAGATVLHGISMNKTRFSISATDVESF